MKPNSLCLRAVDFRAVNESERSEGATGRTMEGYAAVFDTPTEINSFEGFFNETIARGAFRKTIKERTPVLQFDHGHDARTGSIPIGKFDKITEDEDGLFVSATLFDNPVVEPIRQAIEGGAVSGMSFRFKVIRDEWRDSKNKRVRSDELGPLLYDAGERGPLHRNIKEVELFEAGPVVFPAYAATTVSVRSMSDDEREALVAEYARSVRADEETEEEIREAAETSTELKGEHGPETINFPAVDDAARSEGTSSETGEENPDDAAPFEGTSAGHRSKRLRELRLAQLAA